MLKGSFIFISLSGKPITALNGLVFRTGARYLTCSTISHQFLCFQRLLSGSGLLNVLNYSARFSLLCGWRAGMAQW